MKPTDNAGDDELAPIVSLDDYRTYRAYRAKPKTARPIAGRRRLVRESSRAAARTAAPLPASVPPEHRVKNAGEFIALLDELTGGAL